MCRARNKPRESDVEILQIAREQRTSYKLIESIPSVTLFLVQVFVKLNESSTCLFVLIIINVKCILEACLVCM